MRLLITYHTNWKILLLTSRGMFVGFREQLDAFMGSLNLKGIRERALFKKLENYYQRIRFASLLVWFLAVPFGFSILTEASHFVFGISRKIKKVNRNWKKPNQLKCVVSKSLTILIIKPEGFNIYIDSLLNFFSHAILMYTSILMYL